MMADRRRYYIMFHPAIYNLMELSGTACTSPYAILSYLTGRNATSAIHEDNYLDFLHFDAKKLRGEILEYFGMENYASYYIANQLALADPGAAIILADSRRRQPDEIIRLFGRKPDGVFISTISSSFPTAVAATLPLNHARIPVILGGIHVSTSSRDVDTFLRNQAPFPRLITHVKGAGDAAVIARIVGDIRAGALQPEYIGTRTIENGIWGHPNVSALPPMPLRFFRKLPVAGAFLGDLLRIKVTTPYLGCPYSCRFCSISTLPRNQRIFSYRHAEDFVNELEHFQKEKHSFTNRLFFFLPDNLLLARNKLEAILDLIIQRNLKLNYAAQISINVAEDEALLKKLRLSGASHFFIGFESLNIRNLEYIGKEAVRRIRRSGMGVSEYYAACIRNIIRHGISIHGAFIIGLPYDYFHSLSDHTGREIARFCIQNRIGLQPASLTALPGSITFMEQQEAGTLLYGTPGSMDYLISLCLTDLSEMNQIVPAELKSSPLVVAYMVYDAVRRVGSSRTALFNAAYMATQAWLHPTKAGKRIPLERFWGLCAAAVFQLGASAYKELGESLVRSGNGIRGTFERLYDQEKNPEVKHLFRHFIQAFRGKGGPPVTASPVNGNSGEPLSPAVSSFLSHPAACSNDHEKHGCSADGRRNADI